CARWWQGAAGTQRQGQDKGDGAVETLGHGSFLGSGPGGFSSVCWFSVKGTDDVARSARGANRGSLVGVVGVRAARAGAVVQGGEALGVEAMEPLVELAAADAEELGNGAGPLAHGEALDDPSPLNRPGLVGTRAGEPLAGLMLLGRQLAQVHLGRHRA